MDESGVNSGYQVDGTAQTLSTAWDDLVNRLPEDWSHLLVEVEVQPEASNEPVVVIVSALNPQRCDSRTVFRFRVGRDFGYGASAQMARHCLDQLDKARVEGRLHLLEMLSQRRPVETQGPIWRLGGSSL